MNDVFAEFAASLRTLALEPEWIEEAITTAASVRAQPPRRGGTCPQRAGSGAPSHR
jgi:hypothetical protein